jgi:hypothetical protein
MNKSALHLIWQDSRKWILLDVLSFILGVQSIIKTLYTTFTYTSTETAAKSAYMFNLHFDGWDILRLIIGVYLTVTSVKNFKKSYI